MSRVLIVVKEVAIAAVLAGGAAVLSVFAQRHPAEAATGFTDPDPESEQPTE